MSTKTERCVSTIIESFKNGSLPEAMAHAFLDLGDTPMASWSWGNKILAILSGATDGRTYRQWLVAGRQVRKGEKAFHILEPLTRVVLEDGEKRTFVKGFKMSPRFDVKQTDGDEVPAETEARRLMSVLPFAEVAQAWGIKTTTSQAVKGCGSFCPEEWEINMSVENASTWCHELIHAADFKRGNLELREYNRNLKKKIDAEIIAELGGAVLLCMIGEEKQADLGGAYAYITSYAGNGDEDVIKACNRLMADTCNAVSLVMETYEEIQHEKELQRLELSIA